MDTLPTTHRTCDTCDRVESHDEASQDWPIGQCDECITCPVCREFYGMDDRDVPDGPLCLECAEVEL